MSFPFGREVFEAYIEKVGAAHKAPPHRRLLSMDFETFSECDLPKSGASRYARHETTEVLMLAYGWAEGEVKQYVPPPHARRGQTFWDHAPADLVEAVNDPSITLSAWNAPFESAVMRHTLGMSIPHDRWLDVMALSFSLSLPGKLEKCGEVVGLGEDQKKMARGKALIRRFCMPRKPTKNKPWLRSTAETDPDEWQEFLEYNIRDVEAERAIYRRLKKFQMPDHEWKLWHLDQKINDAGIPINLKAVRAAVCLAEATTTKDLAEMRRLTGLANPNSNVQILPWLRAHGYNFTDLKKGHVERAANAAEERVANAREFIEKAPAPLAEYFRQTVLATNELLCRVLHLRLRVSKAGVKKYPALLLATDDDGMLRGCHQFAGAGRTWRWSGRRFQPQNLPKPSKGMEKFILTLAPEIDADGNELSDLDRAKAGYAALCDDIEHLSIAEFWAKYERDDLDGVNTMEALTAAIRPMVHGKNGKVLVDADLSAIENVVLGWLARDDKILRVFREGLDPYIDFATDMFKMSYAEIAAEVKSGNKSKRTTAKPGVLGCFGADTPVLTDRGWVRIVEVRDTDKLFDGDRWVSHGGVAYQGRKAVINHKGLTVTPDHRILAYRGALSQEWIGASTWAAGLSSAEAHALANGKFSIAAEAPARQERFIDAVVRAEWNGTSEPGISFTKKPAGVTVARRKVVADQLASGLGLDSTISSQIVSTLRAAGARTPTTRITSITGVGEFVCGSGAPTSGSNTWLTTSAQTEASKSTDETMTATTSREICVSQPGQSKTETSETWDILNTGDRNRFVVLKDDGPLVVHNCGYMLGAGDERENRTTGEIEATGLLGYAWAMDVPLTKEMAKLSVDTFRAKFADVVQFWDDLDKAVRRVIKTRKPEKVGYLEIDFKKPFLRIKLPSGRYLHYMRPRIESRKMPWKDKNGKPVYRPSITYENMENGQWRRVTTHPGKLAENVTQAVARDILAHGMTLAGALGIDIRLHVHDQAVALALPQDAARQLAVMIRCLTTRPPWADNKLPLKAAGLTTPVFIKD